MSDKTKETPAVTEDPLGIGNAPFMPLEGDAGDTETQTGETVVAPDEAGQTTVEAEEEKVAPDEAGQTTEEGGEREPEKLILGKFKSYKDLEEAYQSSEKSRSQLDQRRAELEASQNAMSALVEQSRRDMEERAKQKEKESELTPEEFNAQYLEKLAYNPREAQKMLLQTPEVKEMVNQMVDEIVKPIADEQNRKSVRELFDKVGGKLTVENGCPVNFKDIENEIDQMNHKRPWLNEAAMAAKKQGEGETFLEYCYWQYLKDNPHLIKGWDGKAPATPPVTETGSGGTPTKGQTPVSAEEKAMREMEAIKPKNEVLL